ARYWGRNDLVGWFHLCRGLAAAHGKNVKPAVSHLAQAREAFRRYTSGMTEVANVFYERARQLVKLAGIRFEMIMDGLSSANREPLDYQPWQLDRHRPLAKRMRCKADGKVMRLVEGGLQPGPDGRELWLYPFYVDEEPVSAAELVRMSGERGLDDARDQAASGPAVTADLTTARRYADWARKSLPIVHEWYAATWQLAGVHQPERWEDWETARERMFLRIEKAILRQQDDIHPRLPLQSHSSSGGDASTSSNPPIEPVVSVQAIADAAHIGPVSNELVGCWSGMIGDWNEDVAPMLPGDPFRDAIWTEVALTPSGPDEGKHVGIRCVLPLFTAQDLDLLEPLRT
ncbi:MAG: hypothetical protein AABP62_29790, partial [Planctomycetota bacterium]